LFKSSEFFKKSYKFFPIALVGFNDDSNESGTV